MLTEGRAVEREPATQGNLDASEWSVLIDLLRWIKASSPAGATALHSYLTPAIVETVRAHFAKLIEQ